MSVIKLACPQCLRPDALQTVERLLGTHSLRISEEAGETQCDYGSEGTAIIWDSATTISLECGCGWSHLGSDFLKSLVRADDE